MDYTIKKFESLEPDIMYVRTTVFVEEQGFKDEFDDVDKIATHLVMYDCENPIATCRFFKGDNEDTFILGRLAVVKSYRGKHLGEQMVAAAEKYALEKGAAEIRLHAQEQAIGFYEKCGYIVCSEMEYEEYCPHYWMNKFI